jgi:hypothetical protein
MKRPPYDPNNKKDFAELEALSNKLLGDEYAARTKARTKAREAEDARWDTYEPSAAEIAMIGGRLSRNGLKEVAGVAAAYKLYAEGVMRETAFEQYRYRQWARPRIIRRLDNKDVEQAILLAGDDPQLLHFIARYRRAPGKQINRRQEKSDKQGDFSSQKKALMNALLAEWRLLHRVLWKTQRIAVRSASRSEEYSPKLTALKIILRRRGYGDDEKLFGQMDNWDKNH